MWCDCDLLYIAEVELRRWCYGMFCRTNEKLKSSRLEHFLETLLVAGRRGGANAGTSDVDTSLLFEPHLLCDNSDNDIYLFFLMLYHNGFEPQYNW